MSVANIFLSYCWADKQIADEVEAVFDRVGFRLRRDIHDAQYRDDIKVFMQEIGKADYVIMILSDGYLKSENCMYEVTELLQTHQLKKRVLPVLLDDCRGIFKATGRKGYYDHWAEEVKKNEQLRQGHRNRDYADTYQKVVDICNKLDLFFTEICPLVLTDHQTLKDKDYRPLFKVIDFDERKVEAELVKLHESSDLEDADLKMELLFKRFPENRDLLFARATLASKHAQHRRSKHFFEQLLTKFPDFVDGHVGLASTLIFLDDIRSARSSCKAALEINPKSAEAHYSLGYIAEFHDHNYPTARHYYEKSISLDANESDYHRELGVLLMTYYKEYIEAEKHLKKSVELYPGNATAYLQLGHLYAICLKDYAAAKKNYDQCLAIDTDQIEALRSVAGVASEYLKDYQTAKIYLQRIIKILPADITANYNLGHVMAEHLADFKGARKQFETILQLNPAHANAHHSLGYLLQTEFKEYLTAKKHYEKCLKVEPNNALTHFNLGFLCSFQLHDYRLAKSHFEACLHLDPLNAECHFYFALLLYRHFNEPQRAKNHYVLATRLDKSLIDSEADQLFNL